MPRRTPSPALLNLEPDVPNWQWETTAWSEGWEIVAGVDEAGRGPLAGPVAAAAVVLPRGIELAGLRDSKCLQEAQREELYARIVEVAVCWAVELVEPEEIDRLNILRATHIGMARALARLSQAPCGALVDGLPAQGLPCPHRALVRGDARCMSIAAAAILAKVTRDRHMVELDRRYPGYGLARHKGYPTRDHMAALRELGPSPCHRLTFRPVAELQCSTSSGATLAAPETSGSPGTEGAGASAPPTIGEGTPGAASTTSLFGNLDANW